MEGDDHGEAYTTMLWGVGLSHVSFKVAEAEAVTNVEGNMCGTVMRGHAALPGSKATSRCKRLRRNLGDLLIDLLPSGLAGSRREGEEP